MQYPVYRFLLFVKSEHMTAYADHVMFFIVSLITSAKEVMFSSLFICLSLCLLATLRK